MQTKDDRTRQNILPLIVVAILALFVIAMFSGSNDDDRDADFKVSGSMKNGVYVNNDWFSAEVCDINKHIAREYGLSPKTKGVLVQGIDGNMDVLSKVRPGDVITGINDSEVHDLKDFRKAMKKVDPVSGMLLDIRRNGNPMYVSVNGAYPGAGGRQYNVRNPHPFSMTDVAPFMGRDIHFGGLQAESGIFGKQIEKWVESSLGRDYHACTKCGTLVPGGRNSKNNRISCPNCGSHMVSRR